MLSIMLLMTAQRDTLPLAALVLVRVRLRPCRYEHDAHVQPGRGACKAYSFEASSLDEVFHQLSSCTLKSRQRQTPTLCMV